MRFRDLVSYTVFVVVATCCVRNLSFQYDGPPRPDDLWHGSDHGRLLSVSTTTGVVPAFATPSPDGGKTTSSANAGGDGNGPPSLRFHLRKDDPYAVYRQSSLRTASGGGGTSSQPPIDYNISICFITSQYYDSLEAQTDFLINPPNEVPNLYRSPLVSFFVYTNLPQLVAPGWELIVKRSFPVPSTLTGSGGGESGDDQYRFRRLITQSRWPKFQAFRDPVIQRRCQVVFYMDGANVPSDSVDAFQREAHRILTSGPNSARLAQELHRVQRGPGTELRRIVAKQKDTIGNADASLRWLQAQPDYSDSSPMYSNSYFAYAVDSRPYQRVADFFWGHYGREDDSWRDQPLWSYALHHCGVSPMNLTAGLIRVAMDRIRGGQHTYIRSTGPDPFDQYWEDLTPDQRESARTVLGYTERLWDGNGVPSKLEGRQWDQLTDEEQRALQTLGYVKLLWDYEPWIN
jgi:hypothetical protein